MAKTKHKTDKSHLLFILTTTLILSTLFHLSPVNAHEATVIEMSDSGYSPQDIEIHEGDTVTFINTGQNPKWPASNIHPTHEIYSEFDSKRGLSPGESWSFTFDKPGTWKYHDHIYPQFIGDIVVIPLNPASTTETFNKKKPVTLNSLISSLKIGFLKTYYSLFSKARAEKLDNLDQFEVTQNEEELGFWLKVMGAERMMQDLLTDSGNGETRDCHQPAHQTGRVAFEIYGGEVFQKGDASCHSGFYHGAMESFLQKEGTNNLAQNIEEICDSFPSSFGKFECLHGVGHGLLAYTDYDLPEALENCKELKDEFSQSSCYGGAFMENIVTAQGGGADPNHSTTWANNDPHFPCNALSKETRIQVECYQMQTSWMLSLTGYDFDKVAEYCKESPNEMIPICFRSFGRDAAGHTLRDTAKIMDICGKVADTEYYNPCVYGALNVIVDFWGEGLGGQASDLCQKITILDEKRSCYTLLASRLNDVFVDSVKRAKVCQTFEEEYRNVCTI